MTMTACGDGSAATSEDDGILDVVAAFHQLRFVTERVTGDRATVTSLAMPGAGPHDLELSPQGVATLTKADPVVHEEGFELVEDAIVSDGGDNAIDVAPDADLAYAGDEHEGEGEEHAEGEGVMTPHLWLDPARLTSVVDAVSARLDEVDPDGAGTSTANVENLKIDLAGLDDEFSAHLASCTNRTLVTNHEALGCLAQRYDPTQQGISGLSPDEEPDAGRLAEVADSVRTNQVGTICSETLVSPAVAETVSSTAVPDPLEDATEGSAGSDHLEVQRVDPAASQQGRSCT